MYKAIIIDDEESARESINLLIKKTEPDIEVVAKSASAAEGIAAIKKYQPHIIFLDINMPGKSGLELVDQIDAKNFQIIFITAYDEYAIKAINLSACYYLLKPVSPTEFSKAVKKSIENIEQKNDLSKNIQLFRELISKPNQYPEKIIVNHKNTYELVQVSNIYYLEGDKNYSWLHTKEGKYLAAKTLKDYEETLSPAQFFRIHQSHIVNKDVVKKVHNTKPDQVELSNGTMLAIARDRKKDFLNWLTGNTA